MVCMIKNSSSAEFHGACSNIACCRSGSYAKEAHLPCPEYENQVAGEESFTAKVMFYSSIQFLRASFYPHSLYSYPALTLEVATRDAARQPLEYMEQIEMKVSSTFKDVDLEKRTVELLHHQLEKKNEKLIQKSSQLKQTAVACDAYTKNVTESNRRIKNIIFKSLATDYTTTRDQCRAALLEIQAIHVGLSQQTAKTLVMLKVEGPSPYGEETIDDA